ncbi:uncharacterized protein C5L36_0E00190 [Pichia kudriavzevii]|uniref:TECPR1-like DysF domain-containing protein n=1 Tax=Pichia kudriavzevii TaxID=4909 RepID=A0A2U9R934_PICKU|nr:uncharacterized protein C5L36_0E00190 [Pichia kudriavzevii]AWU77950.1 hypothetical protein C5L36_0E00190 [Pichia kudriavzevii]
MPGGTVYAQFVSFQREYPQSLLGDTPPEVIAALIAIYPVLVTANRILGFITWTTDSCYRNFVVFCLYSLLILHWNNYFLIVLPTIMALSFCCYAWFIRKSYVEFGESGHSSPTIEEVLNTLDNFTMRSSLIFDMNIKEMASKRKIRSLLTNLSVLTPLYSLFMKHHVSANTWIFMVSLIMYTYYSSPFMAMRQLLWRFKPLRYVAQVLTGEHYPLEDKDVEITILNLNTRESIDRNTKIAELHLVENQRRWLGVGWCSKMFLWEETPSYYSPDTKRGFDTLSQYEFPLLRNYPHSTWTWVDDSWRANGGWTYFDYHWQDGQQQDSLTRYTRRRLLKRKCLLSLRR